MKAFHTSAALAAVLLALSWPALAQSDGKRASQEREALRRAQAALKLSQEQQSTLSREKADLATEKDKASAAARHSEAQLAGVRGEVVRLRADLARVTAELEQAKADAAQETVAAQSRAETQAGKLASVQAQLNEKAQTLSSVVALLERSTQSLAAAEKTNREMQQLGLQLVAQLRQGQAAQGGAATDALLGFDQIKLENSAEQWRDQLDALKLARGR